MRKFLAGLFILAFIAVGLLGFAPAKKIAGTDPWGPGAPKVVAGTDPWGPCIVAPNPSVYTTDDTQPWG